MSISPLSLAMRKQPVDTSYVGSRYSNYDMHIVGRRGQFSAFGRAGGLWKNMEMQKKRQRCRAGGKHDHLSLREIPLCCSRLRRQKARTKALPGALFNDCLWLARFVLGASSPSALTVARLVMSGWASRHPRYYEALEMVVGLGYIFPAGQRPGVEWWGIHIYVKVCEETSTTLHMNHI
jgi:hypothetical protein